MYLISQMPTWLLPQGDIIKPALLFLSPLGMGFIPSSPSEPPGEQGLCTLRWYTGAQNMLAQVRAFGCRSTSEHLPGPGTV